MNLGRCDRLTLREYSGTSWYRAIQHEFYETPLKWDHTRHLRARFNPGPEGAPRFATLHLCETLRVASQEVSAEVVLPDGTILTNPKHSWLFIRVDVRLQKVADLTNPKEQKTLRTNAQELTGDWRGYQTRQPNSPVPQPTGIAPTQRLGQALFDTPEIEGFFVISSKQPDHRNLVVFPEKLIRGSRISHVDAQGRSRYIRARR